MTTAAPVRRRRWSVAAYVLAPLVVLAIDLAASPVIFETSRPRTVSVLSLFETNHAVLGTFRSHAIETGLSRVGHPEYLAAYRDRAPNALAVSVFADEDGGAATATFGKAVLAKLVRLAPAKAGKLGDFLVDSTDFQPGDVRALALELAPEERRKFPIDWIFVVVLEKASGEANTSYYPDLFAKVMQLAVEKDLATLVLPAIGHNWEDQHAATFDDIFRPAVAALPQGDAPAVVYFDLYDQWPTYVVERAVAALNGSAEQFIQPAAAARTLHHRDFRLLLLFLTLCLAASARVAPLNFRAFLIISAAYTGLFLGSGSAIGLFTGSLSAGVRMLAEAIVYLVLALAFPFITQWKLDLVFGSREAK